MGKRSNIIDLFAGCGGLSDGFEQTHLYHTLACVDWEKPTCNTLSKRLKEKWGYSNADNIVLCYDMQKTYELINGWSDDEKYGSGDGLQKMISNSKKTVDIIIGGPPCQAYSIAGRIRDEKGMHDDYRNFLFESYLKIVDHFKPKLFVFENVPGLLSAKPGGISIVKRITESFSECGYEIISDLKKYALIDCTEFGVPQARKRMVIIGINRSMINKDPQLALEDFYISILPKYKSKGKTVKDTIADLPKLHPLDKVESKNGKKYSHDYKKTSISNHIPRMHSKRDMNIFRMLAKDIESGENKYAKTEALKELYFSITGKYSNIHKYHVLKWDKVSNTIPAHLYKDGLRHIHPDPEQARTVTVREAARLQSFDDDFVFEGSMTDQYKMVGNAVPPKFAQAIALAVNDLLKKYLNL